MKVCKFWFDDGFLKSNFTDADSYKNTLANLKKHLGETTGTRLAVIYVNSAMNGAEFIAATLSCK